MAKILVIDDDRGLCEALEQVLSLDKHLVDLCYSGNDAVHIMDFCRYDLFLVDWELGDIKGPDLVSHFRKNGGNSPILMITARADIDSKVEGLEKGVDDYLVKPFDMRELRARVRTLLRRPTEMKDEMLDYRGITLVPSRGSATYNGIDLKLQPLELRLLEFFVRNRGRWFSAEELISRVWSVNSNATDESVRGSIKRLRSALRDVGLEEHLQSARNRGYMID